MFVLDELDKILASLTLRSDQEKQKRRKQMKISLNDVGRVDVDSFKLSQKVHYPDNWRQAEVSLTRTGLDTRETCKFDNKTRSNMTTDELFASLIKPIITTKLAAIPERLYPSAKLIICDRFSYNYMLKLRRIALSAQTGSQTSPQTTHGPGPNFLHKQPYNTSALFLLDDIVDLFNRQSEPLLVLRHNPELGKQVVAFNYQLMKQAFPYIKLSDLVILVYEQEQFDLDTMNMGGGDDFCIIEYLRRFARSSQVIETKSIERLVGCLHNIYDNVIVFRSNESNSESHNLLPPARQPLSRIASMAERMMRIIYKLGLELRSITWRDEDPIGQTGLFAKMVISAMESRTHGFKWDGKASIKVLVLDRSFDLQGPLYHATKYGPFIEQEGLVNSVASRKIKMRIETIDELDSILQLQPLTEVLSSILKYTISLKTSDEAGKNLLRSSRSISSAMSTSQSIRRHMDIVKVIYKAFNEGYLLMLRLEATLENLYNQLQNSDDQPLSQNKQEAFVGTLQRIVVAFKQLLTITSGKTLRVSDYTRVACIIIDVINLFLHLHAKYAPGLAMYETVQSLKTSILNGKELIKVQLRINKEEEGDNYDEGEDDGMFKVKDAKDFLSKLRAFDGISLNNCANCALQSIEQLLESFYQKHLELEQDAFSTRVFSEDPKEVKSILLVCLGSLTAHELARIKSLEGSLRRSLKLSDIYVMCCDLNEPREFLKAL